MKEKDNHTKSADEKSAGYSVQISQYFETGLIGKYKPDMRFEILSPYETGFKTRCVLMTGTTFLTFSVPQAKALYLLLGKELGVMDYRAEVALSKVPYAKRVID